MRKHSLAIGILAPTLSVLSACGGDGATSTVAIAETVEVGEGVVDVAQLTLIDVRDVAEFVTGHLPEATNLPFNDGTLEAQLSSLDPNVAYGVYCRSGNRSGQAVEMMKDAGFTNVVDLGGLEEAVASTGLDLVTN
jgi:rhodanese-related sulfurtransferase